MLAAVETQQLALMDWLYGISVRLAGKTRGSRGKSSDWLGGNDASSRVPVRCRQYEGAGVLEGLVSVGLETVRWRNGLLFSSPG